MTVGGAKLFQEGSIQGYTAYLSKHYVITAENTDVYYGYPARFHEELTALVLRMQSKGWQLGIHNCWDVGSEDYLCALETAVGRYHQKNCHHVALHCIVMYCCAGTTVGTDC